MLERAGECKDQRAVKVLSVLSQVVCAAYSDGKLTGPSDEEISDGMKLLREWKKDSAPESDDGIFTEKLINVFITAADDLKESNRRKAEVNEQKRAAEQAAREAASATANMFKPQQTINLKCKYDANGICTYRSTSSYLAHCTRSGSDQLICSDYKRG